VRKFFYSFVLTVGLVVLAAGAETLTLTDGSSLSGDIIKFDDNGLLLSMPGEVYTNLPWARFSQDSLQQLAQNPKLNSKNPKIASLVEPFIEPMESARPAKPEITVNPVQRLERPASPALIGGFLHSGLGLFILLVLYLANLYAAFEVAVVRGRPIAQVIGLSAVLPVIGPIIFLSLPIPTEPSPEEIAAGEAAATSAPGAPSAASEVQIGDASWKQPEEAAAVKKPEAQVFARGKFTFNKRFIETKFAGFASVEPAGDAKNFTMEVKTLRESFAVERIAQVGAAEVIFETVLRGQVTVPFGDIQEIKLNPKAA
jgi:hypothetical protein